MAISEVCQRILNRDNMVTIRWTPAHAGVEGNEKADEYAKAAAQGEDDGQAGSELRQEASLAHLRRKATVRRVQTTKDWIRDHVKSIHRYKPLKGKGLRQKDLQ